MELSSSNLMLWNARSLCDTQFSNGEVFTAKWYDEFCRKSFENCLENVGNEICMTVALGTWSF